MALTHGNEICGAIALDKLFRAGARPRRGKLTLAFNNVAAYREFDRAYPIASRYIDEDFNRLWSPARSTARGNRPSSPRPRPAAGRGGRRLPARHPLDAARDGAADAGRPARRSRDLAREIGIPELIMCDAGHAAGPRMRDYGGFGDPASPKTALLIECGQHWERRAAEVATDVMLRFLIAPETSPATTSRRSAARFRRASASAHDRGHRGGDDHRRRLRFVEDFRGLEVLREKGSLIGRDAAREVRTPYDNCVLIMPSRRLVRARPRCGSGAMSTDRDRRSAAPKRSFPPIVDRRSRVLVLGTLPGEDCCAAANITPTRATCSGRSSSPCSARGRRRPTPSGWLLLRPRHRAVGRVSRPASAGERRFDDPRRAAERDRHAARRRIRRSARSRSTAAPHGGCTTAISRGGRN